MCRISVNLCLESIRVWLPYDYHIMEEDSYGDLSSDMFPAFPYIFLTPLIIELPLPSKISNHLLAVTVNIEQDQSTLLVS